jgi:hypothetical protein
MAEDSHLFESEPKNGYVALYEGKMIQAYDHRAASVVFIENNTFRPNQPSSTNADQYINPSYTPKPLYWVSSDIAFIVPMLELVYTAWDIKAFAEDVWNESGEESEDRGASNAVVDTSDEDRSGLARALEQPTQDRGASNAVVDTSDEDRSGLARALEQPTQNPTGLAANRGESRGDYLAPR